MKAVIEFIKRYLFYALGFLLLGWGITSTIFLIKNSLEMQRQSGLSDEVIVATGFVPYEIAVNTPTPMPSNVPPENILTPTSIPQPTATPTPKGEEPVRFVIKELGIDAPVIDALVQLVEIDGKTYQQWTAPDEPAVGWQTTSAGLGVPGNTVLIGHHNVYGKIFLKLVYLVPGDKIDVYGQEKVYHYAVANKMLVEERDVSIEKRLENAQWLLPSSDERLTIITCWPETSNTHRLIIVAVPEGTDLLPTPTGTILP